MAETKRMTTDTYRELLHVQAKALKDAVDRCARAERALSAERTRLHWVERELADARAAVAARKGQGGAESVSAALRGLDGYTGTPPVAEPVVKPWPGDEAVTVRAAVDLTAAELVRHLAERHDPGYFATCAHTQRAYAVFHDSAHVLAREAPGTILHTHVKTRRKADDDD
jgi:hypothetical protein